MNSPVVSWLDTKYNRGRREVEKWREKWRRNKRERLYLSGVGNENKSARRKWRSALTDVGVATIDIEIVRGRFMREVTTSNAQR